MRRAAAAKRLVASYTSADRVRCCLGSRTWKRVRQATKFGHDCVQMPVPGDVASEVSALAEFPYLSLPLTRI